MCPAPDRALRLGKLDTLVGRATRATWRPTLARLLVVAGLLLPPCRATQAQIAPVLANRATHAMRRDLLSDDSLRSLRRIAESDTAGLALVRTADQVERLVPDSSADQATLAEFLHAKEAVRVAQDTLAAAHALLDASQINSYKLDDLYRSTDTLLIVYRRSRTFGVCKQIYYFDPDYFVLNQASCEEHYSKGGVLDRKLHGRGAIAAGVELVRYLLPGAESRVEYLARGVDSTADRFEDALRGRLSVKWVIGVASGSTVVVLLLLVFARPDVRDKVFKHVHATEFVTLILVVMAVLYFGSISYLNAEAVAGLLGSIAGYVLGRQTQALSAGHTQDHPESRGGAQPPAVSGRTASD